MPPKAMNRAHRTLVFTWNNPTYEILTTCFGLLVKYVICQLEMGNEGTPHYQGYAVFSRPVKYEQAARELGLPEGQAHFEGARGTPEDNRRYCTKAGALEAPIEFGDINEVGQGKRSDLKAAAATAMDVTVPVCDMYLQHPTVTMRYSKGMDKLRDAAEKKALEGQVLLSKRRKVKCHVYWGPAGSGKTTKALQHSDLYILPSSEQGSTIWFDGYMGQKNILIEDFTPNCVSIKSMLNICDGAPMRFPIKGGFILPAWTRVYITSNYHPQAWYTQIEPESQAALSRRLTRIEKVDLPEPRFGGGQQVSWNDMSDQDDGSCSDTSSDSDVQIVE